VVQAAAEEFSEHGYENATLEGVSRRVGITKASLYHYIRTKDDLLYAVIERPAHDLLEQLEALRELEGPVAVRLRELFRVQVRIFASFYPASFVYLGQLGRNGRHDFDGLERRYVRGLEDLIAEGIERGEFSLATSPQLAARAVIGMLDWMMHWYRPGGALPPHEVADQLFSIAVGGLVAGSQVSALLGPTPEPQGLPQ
jgi:TetR/AcrR family transcriptional regulator, cholesterol catabolism regulator